MKKITGRSTGLDLLRYFVSGAMAVLPLIITVTVVAGSQVSLTGFNYLGRIGNA